MKYHYISESEQLEEAIRHLSGQRFLAISVLSTGPDPYLHTLRMIGLNSNSEDVWLVEFTRFTDAASKEPLRALLGNAKTVKVLYHAKEAVKFLKVNGILLCGTLFDPYLAAQLLTTPQGPNDYQLAALALFFLQHQLTVLPEEGIPDHINREDALVLQAQATAILLPLRAVMVKQLVENQLVDVAKIEFDCVYGVVDMELTGMYLNQQVFQTLGEQLHTEAARLEKELAPLLSAEKSQMNLLGETETTAVNLDSPEQLRVALSRRGIDLPDTSRHTLNQLAVTYPEVAQLLKYRKVAKQLNTFIDALPNYIHPVTGRIHSHYQQMGAGSGRFSCSSPNIQGTPREEAFRNCFQAAPGHVLVIADYSQIELRVAAEVAQDARMIKAYREGEDLHRLTASLVTGLPIELIDKKQRQAAKAINFGLVYAMGAKGLQTYARDTYGADMTLEQAEQFRQRFFIAYRGIYRWHQKVRLQNEADRKAGIPAETRTLSGRRYIWSTVAGLAGLYNMPVQGTAADIAKKAICLIYQENVNPNWHLIGFVHDEILMEVPQADGAAAKYFLKTQMERAGKFILKTVPVAAEANIGNSWADAK